jgi:hypothetical protein
VPSSDGRDGRGLGPATTGRPTLFCDRGILGEGSGEVLQGLEEADPGLGELAFGANEVRLDLV